MTDQMRDALEKIANLDYITPGCEADALRSATSIAREALASAQQADHIGDVSEMVAAPVVPADVIDAVSKALRKAWQLGQTYWQQADHEFASYHRKADETQAKFDALVDETRALFDATSPAPEQREKVELTDVEIDRVWIRKVPEIEGVPLPWVRKFGRAVLAAYEAKQKGGAA